MLLWSSLCGKSLESFPQLYYKLHFNKDWFLNVARHIKRLSSLILQNVRSENEL